MDWGSKMLDSEDYESVIKFGILCGFDLPECDQHYSVACRFSFTTRDGVEGVHFSGHCTKYLTHPGMCSSPLTYRFGWLSNDVHTTPVEITWQGRK
jgi:hypothetical protein